MISVRVSATLRMAYFDALLAQPISALDKYPKGEVTTAITSSTNTIQISISDKFSILLQTVAMTISAYAIAFKWCWQLTLVTSSSMLFIVVVYTFVVPPFIKGYRKMTKIEDEASSLSGEVFGAIRTVFALGASPELKKRYSETLDEARRVGLKLSPWVAGQFSPAFFAIYCAYALCFWYGLKLYSEGTIHDVNTVIM